MQQLLATYGEINPLVYFLSYFFSVNKKYVYFFRNSDSNSASSGAHTDLVAERVGESL